MNRALNSTINWFIIIIGIQIDVWDISIRFRNWKEKMLNFEIEEKRNQHLWIISSTWFVDVALIQFVQQIVHKVNSCNIKCFNIYNTESRFLFRLIIIKYCYQPDHYNSEHVPNDNIMSWSMFFFFSETFFFFIFAKISFLLTKKFVKQRYFCVGLLYNIVFSQHSALYYTHIGY